MKPVSLSACIFVALPPHNRRLSVLDPEACGLKRVILPGDQICVRDIHLDVIRCDLLVIATADERLPRL